MSGITPFNATHSSAPHFGYSERDVSNLGHGLGVGIKAGFEFLAKSWTWVCQKSISKEEIAQRTHTLVYRNALPNSIRLINLELEKISRMNPNKPLPLKNIERLISDNIRYLTECEDEKLHKFQKKQFKTLEQTILKLHPLIKAELKNKLPILFENIQTSDELEKLQVNSSIELNQTLTSKNKQILLSKRRELAPNECETSLLSFDLNSLKKSQGFATKGGTTIVGSTIEGVGNVGGSEAADFVVGAHWTTPNGIYRAGRIFIVWGDKDLSSIDFANFSAEDGLIIDGVLMNGGFGYSITKLKDYDGNGFDDFAVSAPFVFDTTQSGIVYIFLGPFSEPIDLRNPGKKVIKLYGRVLFGSCMTGGKDHNGDGKPDLAVGNPYAPGGGEFTVVYGNNTWIEQLNVTSQLTENLGYTGIGTKGFFGCGIDFGYIDDDVIADIAVGDPASSPSGLNLSGMIHVFYGQKGTKKSPVNLNNTRGFTAYGASGDKVGYPLSIGGDLNKNGKPDLIIGSPSGKIFAMYEFPSQSASVNLETLGSKGTVMQPPQNKDLYGLVITDIDYDNDGNSDLIVTMPKYSPNGLSQAGAMAIVRGQKEGLPSRIDLATLSGVQGSFIKGTINEGQFGYGGANVGDSDGDGFNDVVISAPSIKNGSIYFFRGQNVKSCYPLPPTPTIVPPTTPPIVPPATPTIIPPTTPPIVPPTTPPIDPPTTPPIVPSTTFPNPSPSAIPTSRINTSEVPETPSSSEDIPTWIKILIVVAGLGVVGGTGTGVYFAVTSSGVCKRDDDDSGPTDRKNRPNRLLSNLTPHINQILTKKKVEIV